MLSGTFSTPVRELVLVAAGLSNLTLHDITLVSGFVLLQPDRTLRDYSALRDAQGFLLTVRSPLAASSSSTPPGTTVHRPNASREPIMAGPTRHVPHESSYVITVIFESGEVMTTVVWASMTALRLRHDVSVHAGVSSETVFLHFAGSILDTTRIMSDPPAITAGALVQAFFSADRALRYVLHLLQGGDSHQPQPPPASSPATFGPPLPPGFNRHPPSPPAVFQFFTWDFPSGSSASADKLRSTFKCPKFLGEVRH